ncbi:sigma-70 family RNA polymerase sigma factor [Streptomyces sp. NBC_00035]|uniref:sigma-70 family RNA polymerase sigma factor n=1 Tax=Streptomyces sp. NBC_00035 TaxID=2903614 RepID=UPI0032458A05
MNDGPTAAYARLYEEQQPRLVAYARSLTRNSWTAEDLVAEAHFRVWRRLSAGHEIDNVPAYLMTTVRHLATAAGSAVRETPRDPQVPEQAGIGAQRENDSSADPAEQVSSVDLLVRVLGQLPERWVKALWLAEAEGQPLAAVGSQIGSNQGATAVLLHRAREGMRQAFLQVQTGAPDDPACQVHWARMPAYVRGTATSRQSERLLGHVDACDDCRERLSVLVHANNRLPALVGPALLVFVLGGAGKFLLPFAAGSAGTVVAAAGGQGGGSGLLHGVRDAVTGGSKVPAVIGAGATAAGIAAALFLSLGPMDSSPVPSERLPVAQAPVQQSPVAEAPVVQPPPQGPAEEADNASAGEAGVDVSADRAVSVLVRAADTPTGSADSVPARAGQEEEPGEVQGDEEPRETPEVETPVTETPAAETPVTEVPPTDPPKTETPGADPPAAEPPAPPTPEPTPDPEPYPDPATPTPADPIPVEEPPAPPATDGPTEPTPADPDPQPTPSDPGDDCGH